MISPSREAALDALRAFRRSGTWPQDALDSAIRKRELDQRDAALSERICRGVLRNYNYLVWQLNYASSRDVLSLQPPLADILLLSAYQILFLDRVPVHAAVSQGVELAKSACGQRTAGIVNAILRKIAASADRLPEVQADSRQEYLSIRWSHPLWFVEEMYARLGESECESFLRADAMEPDLTLQINPLKTNLPQVTDALGQLGAEKIPWLEGAFRISKSGAPTGIPLVRDGSVWIQDAAARYSVKLSGIRSGDTIFDACAAPGGKTFAAAAECGGCGSIHAFDVSEKKLVRLRTQAEVLGVPLAECRALSAAKYDPTYEKQADVLIADVPCSGMGTLRKNPDARFKTAEEIKKLPNLQLDILNNVSSYVKPGGKLLYTTCSVRKEENEEVVNAFLQEHKAFSMVPFRGPFGENTDGVFTFWPHVHGTDGFFAALLRRGNTEWIDLSSKT